jgi:phage-related protein
VKNKINHALYVVSYSKIISSKFFNKIEGEDGLYEVRVEFESNIYRIFCCFDEGNLVILFNGFQKKNQKTPRQEIDKALNIRKLYYKSKSNGK